MLLRFLRERLRDNHARFLNMRASRLWHKGNLPEAERNFRAAIDADRRYAPAYGNLGAVLMEMHRYDEGFALLERAASLNPKHAGILVNLGNAYYRSGQVKRAIDTYQHALELDPGNIEASTNLTRPLLEICDWDALDRHLGKLRQATASGGATAWLSLVSPYTSLFLPFTRQEQLLIARHAALEWAQMPRQFGRKMATEADTRGKRLRIGYLSSDFHDHATAHLTLGIYGKHDRSRFEIHAYSIGQPDASTYRRKIAEDCDEFVDVHELSEEAIAARIAQDRIDILVDLKGYTGGSRPGVLARRPAPIQVNYLGYPGTMGADFIDYLIADPLIIPDGHSTDYAEAIIRLPDTYQPTDDMQVIADSSIGRLEAGLPAEGFVFCCFNTPSKIDKRSFSCWMKILAHAPNSVLWLLQTSPEVQANLSKAAHASGIGPARLVYGSFFPKAQHLARLRLADLVLDTFIYNAHTTATDALWAGIPVLTLTGETFASRVATSLLHAVGFPALATRSESEYIKLAVDLATDSNRLKGLKDELSMNTTKPLFNTRGYVKNLEHAYAQMYALRQR